MDMNKRVQLTQRVIALYICLFILRGYVRLLIRLSLFLFVYECV